MNYSGHPYPIFKKSQGLLSSSKNLDKIKSNILCILLTNPNERVMLPEFGTPLRSLLFDPNDDVLADNARNMIINSIKRWEPRIVVQSIDISSGVNENLNYDTSSDHVLYISISFSDPENIKEIQELNLELPLSTGNSI